MLHVRLFTQLDLYMKTRPGTVIACMRVYIYVNVSHITVFTRVFCNFVYNIFWVHIHCSYSSRVYSGIPFADTWYVVGHRRGDHRNNPSRLVPGGGGVLSMLRSIYMYRLRGKEPPFSDPMVWQMTPLFQHGPTYDLIFSLVRQMTPIFPYKSLWCRIMHVFGAWFTIFGM